MMLLKIVCLLFIVIVMIKNSSAVCDSGLGSQIADSQFSASSEWDGDHAASQGRLNYQETASKAGAWAARYNNANQWLKMYLGNAIITRIATQGRDQSPDWPHGGHTQWVTKYKLQYSSDGVNFQYYKEQGTVKEFAGNSDRNTVVSHVLNSQIEASFIRFEPTAWHGHISMRVELYGCRRECLQDFGVQSGAILNSQMSASSQSDSNHATSQGRLNYQETASKSGAWAARHNNVNQWLQIDLGQMSTVRTLATQGRNYNSNWPNGNHTQWVTKYNIQYGNDGENFKYYEEQGRVKEFRGNKDRNTVVYNVLNLSFSARYIRFRPTGWHGHISMRVELFGCLDG